LLTTEHCIRKHNRL